MDFKTAYIAKNIEHFHIENKDGTVTITAGGEDIWGTFDEFGFLYQTIQGDFSVSAKIVSLDKIDLYTKAGIMARSSLKGDSAHAMFLAFADNDNRNNNNGAYEFQSRCNDGGECTGIYPETATGEPPHPANYPNTWLRLVRKGDVFTAYSSKDGQTWKHYSAIELMLPEELLVGIAVTSHNTEEITRCVVQDIEFQS